MTAAYDFDGKVRLADPDRWTSSRFVTDEAARADLMVLYAFEAELAAIPAKVAQPMLAEMRYAWWSEQLGGVFSAAPRKGHPVLEALADVVERRGLDRRPFDRMIEGRVGLAHGEPHDLDALFAAPTQIAVRALAGPGHEEAAQAAGRLWGLIQTGRLDEAKALRRDTNIALRHLPSAAFPAVAHAALRQPDAPDAVKRLGLTWAVLRGRI